MPPADADAKAQNRLTGGESRSLYEQFWNSVRGRLTLLVATVTLPAFLLASLLVTLGFKNEKKSVSEHLLGTTRACCALLDSQVEHRLLLLHSLSSSVVLTDNSMPAFADRARVALGDPVFVGHVLSVYDAQGVPIVSTAANAATRPLPAEVLARALEKKDFISNYQESIVDRSPEIFVASPVYRNGTLKYILGINFSPSVFTGVTDIPGLAPNAIVGVVDRNMILLTRSHRAKEYVGKQAAPMFVAAARGHTSGVFEARTLEDIPVLTGFQTSGKTGWGIVIGAPKAELYASGIRLISAGLLAIVALAFIAILMARWVGRAVVHNVDNLVRDVESVGRSEIPSARQGGLVETDFVARAIRTNAERLHERERHNAALYKLVARVNQAAELEEVYSAALDSFCRSQNATRAAILLRDAKGVMQFVAWREISETYRDVVGGHSPWASEDPQPEPVVIDDVDTAALPPEIMAAVKAEGIRALAFIPLTYERRLLGKCMLYFNAPRPFSALDRETSIAMASQVAFAIARQRASDALESLVDERTASLREAIAQMQEFSYTVSHDLRAPVRAMSGFAWAIMEDYGKILPEDGRHLLERILKSGKRMDQLIQDLLTYSQISQGHFELEPADVGVMIREIVQQNPSMQPDRARIEVQTEIPPVVAHLASLGQVISNLLINGIKFMPAGRFPVIKIHATCHDGMVRVTFEDNGIGIDLAHQERIFAPFERLHSRSYEGTGIGLSIVRKAVERMHGKAGVISDGVNGSQFWIELPAA